MYEHSNSYNSVTTKNENTENIGRIRVKNNT